MLCQINPLFWLIESLYWWYFDNAKQLLNNHFLKTNDMKKLFSVFLELKKFSTSKEYTELFGFILNKQAFEC